MYKKIPAKYIRGGTSKGLFFKSNDLPPSQEERDSFLLKIMGSPDPTGFQIDGMGGGISSSSKVAIISKINIKNTPYLNYNFGQVSIKEKKIDWSGNCGNLASALFEFAKEEKDYFECFEKNTDPNIEYTHILRVWQENKKHEMMIWGFLDSEKADKLIKISGLQHLYSPIFVEFKDLVPKNYSLFPTGNLIDKIEVDKDVFIEATLLLGANSYTFIKPEALNLKGSELPNEINFNSIKEKIDIISKKSASLMKIQLTEAFRVAWVASPTDYIDSSGKKVFAQEFDISTRVTANGRVHHALPGTGAINIGIASMIKGTLPYLCLTEESVKKCMAKKEISIGHPGGLMECQIELTCCSKNEWNVCRAGFIRNARILMEGFVYP